MVLPVVIDDLWVRRGGLDVLRGLSLALAPGLHRLRGRNGAGKSTLLRTIAGVTPPWRGRIAIAGHDLVRDPVAARARLGWMPETTELFAYLRARELFELVAATRTVDPGAALDDCRALAVDPELRLGALSSGQRRKVLLVSALVGDPQVLLLDEPTNTLDAAAVAWLGERLVGRGEGTVALIATHTDELALAWTSTIELAR